mgnify:CR=1 FL=1
MKIIMKRDFMISNGKIIKSSKDLKEKEIKIRTEENVCLNKKTSFR